jgi:MerR family transcriptional regulator, copper efflux regulator
MSSSDPLPRLLQIGEIAERVGLSLRTVRYYEEMGLIVPEKRTEGGFRLYGNEEIERLKLIMQMKPLGFSVQEMGDMIDARVTLRENPDDADAQRRFLELAEHAERLRDKMRKRLANAEGFVVQLKDESRAFAPTREDPSADEPVVGQPSGSV